jgi:hypothetical protein
MPWSCRRWVALRRTPSSRLDPRLGFEVVLILGALDSDQALQEAVDGTGQSLPEAAAITPEDHAPIGAYLKSVRVQGSAESGRR